MKTRLLTIFAFSALAALSANGQTAPLAKIEIKDLKLESQQTPQMQAPNLVDKKWKPKTWLEVSMELDVKLAPAAGGRDGSLPALEVKYYVALNQMSKDGKTIVLTGSVNYQNIPAGECHTLAFIAPSTLKRILQKDNGGKTDVKAVGVEVLLGGTLATGKSTIGGQWWLDPQTKAPSDKMAFEDGGVISKAKTPFAPFWGDYDVPAADK